MKNLTSLALFFLAAGLLTSVTILSAYQVLFTISVIYFTFLAMKNKEFHLPKSAWWLFAFAIVAIISISINLDIVPKPSKNYGRVKYYFYGILGIFVFRYWLQDATDKVKKILANTFFLSVVVGGLWTMGVYFFTDDTRGRPLTETMRYGYGSAMFLLTLLSALLHKEKLKGWLEPRWGWIAFVIGFLGMFFTFTRGALLGFIVGLPFVLYYYKPKIAKIGAAICVLIVGILAGYYFFGSGTSKFRFLSTKSISSDQIRTSQWQAATIAIKEKPLFGYGLSNFHTQLKRIKDDYDLPAKDYVDAHAHNLFLEVGSGTGLIGLFLFLGWVLTWAWELFKADGLVRALIIPFGAAFVVSSQFEVTFDANNASMIFFVYAMSLGSIKILRRSE